MVNIFLVNFAAIPTRWNSSCDTRYANLKKELSIELQLTLELIITISQLSCDLNPTPIQEGNGFDYSEIARRAAANLALARE